MKSFQGGKRVFKVTLSDLILTNGDYSAFTVLRIKFKGSPLKPFHIAMVNALIDYGEYEVELFRGNGIVLKDGKHEHKEKNSAGG